MPDSTRVAHAEEGEKMRIKSKDAVVLPDVSGLAVKVYSEGSKITRGGRDQL
jgi:hypothetical protein